MQTNFQNDCLIRYSQPFEVSDSSQIPKQPPIFNYKDFFLKLFKESNPQQQPTNQQLKCSNIPFSKMNTNELLEEMFPARYWCEQGVYYGQVVNKAEPERDALKDLEEEFERKLRMRQARKIGICPVREDLHNQLFDEIIRQCTINCPERGILLMRVRDQLKMTLAAYQTLYQGSIIFGIKKQLEAEDGREEMEIKMQQLKEKKIYLQNKVVLICETIFVFKKMELSNILDSLEYSFQAINEMEEKKRNDELKFLQQQSKHLELFLKAVQKQS